MVDTPQKFGRQNWGYLVDISGQGRLTWKIRRHFKYEKTHLGNRSYPVSVDTIGKLERAPKSV